MSTNAITKYLHFSLFWLLLFPSIGYGVVKCQYYNPVTEDEVKLLPHYLEVKVRSFCHDKTEDVVREYKQYSDKLGFPVYSPLHHYGLGLIYMQRVKSRTNYPKRGFDLRAAIGEFGFVIQHSPPSSFVLYEVYYKRGEAFLLNDDLENAMKDFNKSAALKPEFLNAYVMLSECYRRVGDEKRAEEVIKLGQSRAGQKQKTN
jgi:tetratricopeptide (TPR) repeat protein